MPNTALNRTTQALLTNKSGGALVYGDVVVLDNTNANGFTTTTTAGLSTRQIGVILEPNGIANNASGMVALGAWCPKVNLNTAATVGQFIKTHTVAGQATPHSSPQVEGDFGVALDASATPSAILFGSPNGPSAGGSGTVTNTGALTANKAIIGNGGVDVTVSAATGVAHLSSGTLTGSNVVESEITLADNTTNNVSTSAHGFMPKLPSGVPGVLLGIVGYAAGTDTTLHTQSSNTLTDMDAANVLVTFTTPVSTNVLIRCSVLGNNNASGDHYFGLRESTTTIAEAYVAGQIPTGSVANRLNVSFYLTGLSAGSHTYKLAHRVTVGSVSVYTGPAFGQAMMEVWAA